MGIDSGSNSGGDFNSALFSAFISFLYSQGMISVPADFRTRLSAIRYMLDSDFTGLINTLLDYSVNSASSTSFTVECADDTLKEILNQWLKEVNIEVNGVPTGIDNFATEYYKERWQLSSFILSRCTKWEDLKVNNTTVKVPTILYLVNSASIYVNRDKDNFELGTDKLYLDKAYSYQLPQKGEKIVYQKPFDRWYTEYATPYLIRKGVYRNYKALEILQEKTEEVITKFIPYLYRITKGTEKMYTDAKVDYSQDDLKKVTENLHDTLSNYKREKGKTPVHTSPFDEKFEHDIPDLGKILKEDLFNQGYRAILAGLGFIDVIQGIASTRKEAVLNPAPFIEEVNSGVDGFKKFLIEIIYQIMKVNGLNHSRLMDVHKKFYIANTPLKINTAQILEMIKQGYVFGAVSIDTFHSSLGIDHEAEIEKMKDEWKNGERELCYPHYVQNKEEDDVAGKVPPVISKPAITKKQVEKLNEKTGKPDMKYKVTAELDETENYFRNRVENPSLFRKDTFKTIILSKEKGIKAIVAKKKDENSLTIQSILFDKEMWTKDEANKWLKQHEYAEYASLTDNLEDAPYHDLKTLPDSVRKLPEKKQRQWAEVWNSVYKKTKDEARAFRSAWSQVHKNSEKSDLGE